MTARFNKLITDLIMNGLKEGKPFADLATEITILFEQEGVDQQLTDKFIRQAREQYTWIASRFPDEQRREQITAIFEATGRQFALSRAKVQERVLTTVLQGISEQNPVSDIEERLSKVLSTGRQYSRTIANTGLAGFDRASNVIDREPDDRFKYAGPPAEREFCRIMMRQAAEGVTYSYEELEAVNSQFITSDGEKGNGQNLPIETFAGGFNCRHRWVTVTPSR